MFALVITQLALLSEPGMDRMRWQTFHVPGGLHHGMESKGLGRVEVLLWTAARCDGCTVRPAAYPRMELSVADGRIALSALASSTFQ